MKAEERHRLQTNELSAWAARAGEYWKQYGNYVLLGLLAIAIAIAAAVWWSRSSEARSAAGWEALRAARESNQAQAYADVADEFPGTAVAAWAKLNEGKLLHRTGAQLVFEDRKGAYQELVAAREAYEAALANPSVPEAVEEQALYRLAQTLETLAGVRDPDKVDAGGAVPLEDAVAAYERLLDRFPETVYGAERVKQHVESLQSESTQEFYAWFAQQNPSPADRPAPRDPATSDLGLDFPIPPLTRSNAPPTPGTGSTSDGPTLPNSEDDEPVEAPLPGSAN